MCRCWARASTRNASSRPSIRSSSARTRAASATVCGGAPSGLGTATSTAARVVGTEAALRGDPPPQPLQQPGVGVAELLQLVVRARHGEPLVQVVRGYL